MRTILVFLALCGSAFAQCGPYGKLTPNLFGSTPPFVCTGISQGSSGGPFSTGTVYSGTVTFGSAISDGVCASTNYTATGLVASTTLIPNWSNLPAGLTGNVKALTDAVSVSICNFTGVSATPSFAMSVSTSSAGAQAILTNYSTISGLTGYPSTFPSIRSPNILGNNITVVFEGDSKTAAASTPCQTSLTNSACLDWGSQLLLLPTLKNRVTAKYNFAVSGNHISDLQGRYTASVHPQSPAVTGNPAYLFVWIGANDLSPTSVATFESALASYWAGAKADGFTVVATTVEMLPNWSLQEKRSQINQWIRGQLAAKSYDILLDFDRLLPNTYDQTFFNTDATHENTAGRYMLAQYADVRLANVGLSDPLNSWFVFQGTGDNNYAGTPNSLGVLTTGADNTAFGAGSMVGTTTGGTNTAFGSQSQNANIVGGGNTSMGYKSMFLSTGGNNTAFGSQSLYSTTGNSNSAFGYEALFNNTTGIANTAVGNMALLAGQTANNNTAVGDAAIKYSTGINNTAVGSGAYTGTTGVTTGNNNTAMGYLALVANTTGGQNTAVGEISGYVNSTNANVSGSYNTWIGYATGPGSATQYSYQTTLGAGVTGTCSNCVVLGRSADGVQIPGTLNVTGHFTLEGVTSTGAVGTGNLVFSSALPTANQSIRTIASSFGDFSPGASAISTAQIAHVHVFYAGVIQSVTLDSNVSGSVQIDVRTHTGTWTGCAAATSIAASAIPALSSAVTYSDSTLTGWSKTIAADTDVCFYLTSPSTLTGVDISLKVLAN